jgi:predicted transcriptional regulator
MSESQHNILLLSIKPEYVVKLFDGTKKVELRKIKPKLIPGDMLVVYACSPVQAIAGVFEVEKVIEGSPKQIWDQVEDIAGISKTEFDSYYGNSSKAYAIFVKKPEQYEPPLHLEYLKQQLKTFHPPQSYKYLNQNEFNQIQTMYDNN